MKDAPNISRIAALIGDPARANMLLALSGAAPLRHRPGPQDAALRHARVCYDHLAGAAGVQLFQSLTQRGYLEHGADGLGLSASGAILAQGFGLAPEVLHPGRPALCRECLDWSMRKSHLAGRLGRALLVQMEIKGWLKRQPASRTILFSATGTAAFDHAFPLIFAGLPLDAAPDSP